MRISTTNFKKIIRQMINDDYRKFVKAFLSIELGIEDEEKLEEIYWEFMKNDAVQLIDEWFYCEGRQG